MTSPTADGGIFTIGSAGYYQVNAKVGYGNNNAGVRQISLIVNGTNVVPGVANNPTTPSGTNGTGVALDRMLKLAAGDTVSIGTYQNSGAALALASAAWNSIDITKVPAAYAGSAVSTYGERNYAASRRQTAATSFVNNTFTTVDWDTDDYTDGIPFAAGVFTVPVAGYYQVTAKVCLVSNDVGSRMIRLLVNGSATGPGTSTRTRSRSVNGIAAPFSRTLKLAAGTSCAVRACQTSGAALTLSGSVHLRRHHQGACPGGQRGSGVRGVGGRAAGQAEHGLADRPRGLHRREGAAPVCTAAGSAGTRDLPELRRRGADLHRLQHLRRAGQSISYVESWRRLGGLARPARRHRRGAVVDFAVLTAHLGRGGRRRTDRVSEHQRVAARSADG